MRRTLLLLIGAALFSAVASALARPKILPPPEGRLYHGLYWGGTGTDTHDPTEHDVAPEDVRRYEEAVGKQTTWVYFSDNWFESRKFPAARCEWIRDLGKIPYVRLMLRSDVDQNHAEKQFTLARIISGKFDNDLRAWGREAKKFGSPILIEWGTEPNGKWFAWNGHWNGGAKGPTRFVEAFRHIVVIMREEDADNLHWVWHVNWFDDPETSWNRFENYYPGADYCDWVALSAYGPLTPQSDDEPESFAEKVDQAYPRLIKIAPGKPVIIAEFGCDSHNRRVSAVSWAKDALDAIFSNRWPAVIGFSWWNEGWQNDDIKKHDTDMIVLHDPALTDIFREEFAQHSNKIQSQPIISE